MTTARNKGAQTALSIAIVGAVLFVAYKYLLPRLRGGSGGSPRYSGGGNTGLVPPQQRTPPPGNPKGPSTALGGLPNRNVKTGDNGAGVLAALGRFVSDWNNYALTSPSSPLNPNNFIGASGYDSPTLDSIQIPFDSLQTLGDLPTTDVLDPNILTTSDYNSLVGDFGPNANGSFDSYDVGSLIDSGSSLDSYQIDSQPMELLSLSGSYFGNGSSDLAGIDTGYDPSLDNYDISAL